MNSVKGRVPIRYLIASWLGLLCATAHAVPITYDMYFEVEEIIKGPDLVGAIFTGSFTVDDAVLESDGLNKLADILAFRIKMGETIWDYLQPHPDSAFGGFRGPGGFGPPGFDVFDGEIVNVRGGVFGTGDFPFVDFSSAVNPVPGDNRFNANYLLVKLAPPQLAVVSHVVGDMRVVRVSEPPTLALLCAGLLGLGVMRRRRA